MWWGLMDLWLADRKQEGRIINDIRQLKGALEPTSSQPAESLNYYLMVIEQVLGVFPMATLGDAVVEELVVDVCQP